mgnify:FL=1
MSAFEIRDAIHTRIVLSPREQEILDHPYVQRLRHIRQLGFVPLVYPSATHDRFSHSIGTMHVAGLLADAICESETSVLSRVLSRTEKDFLRGILRLAGLLHDIGHAPFSHSAESAMPLVSRLIFPKAWNVNARDERPATHEDYTALLIAGMAEEPKAVLTQDEAVIIASLVHHMRIPVPTAWKKHFSKRVNAVSLHAIVRSLISGNADADRMDYLLRDAYFTGVPYGRFDLAWLAANLGSVVREGTYMLAIPESSILALEHFFFARFHMYAQVYMHKTAKCFEYFFQQALKEKEIPYEIPSEREAYAALRDATLIDALSRTAAEHPSSWAGRLMRREPAKRIARIVGNPTAAQKLLRALRRDCAGKGIRIFSCASHKKFLDIPSGVGRVLRPGAQGAFLFGLSAVPMAVTRRSLGITSVSPLAEYASILKHYRQDIFIDDLYILRDDYAAHAGFLKKTMARHRTFAEGEVLLDEEETI